MVATHLQATALKINKSGTGEQGCALNRRAAPARLRPSLAILGAVAALFGETAAPAASNKVRISNLSDVAFGMIPNLSSDAVQSQSVCIYADTNTNGYTVTGIGAGPGGTFQLLSGGAALSYDILWSSSSGQSSGSQLTPNVPLTGQVSAATHQSCSNGPSTTASLVVRLRSSVLSSAAAGSYAGTLTLIIGPE